MSRSGVIVSHDMAHIPPYTQIHVYVHAAGAGDHVRMSGLVVAAVEGGGAGSRNTAEPNEIMEVVGCAGASGLW